MQYGQWFNGIGLSKKIKNAFDDLINVDVHTEIGSLMCQKTLTKKSGSLATSGYYQAVVPNGDVYFFSKTSSEILKRAVSTGVYSKVRDGSGGAFKGAAYYRNYLYYSMDSYLGRYDFGTPSWDDTFQVLTAGVEHPLFQFDQILYIGNGYNVASVDDSGTFSSSVLDQNVEDEIFALTNLGDDLLTLSNPGSYINESSITRWNTYSDSWSYKDVIKQKGAYAFLDSDNYVHVVCVSGDIYLYNGSKLEIFSNIRDAVTTTGHQLTTNFKGKPLIANGGRIFSLHRKNRNLPFALVGEYTCSAGVDATIHSIVSCGDTIVVSWEYSGTYGIDEIDTNYYANARIITPRFTKANCVKVFYDDLNSASIGIYTRLDGETDWTAHTVLDDSEDNRCVRTVDDMLIKSGAQALITVTPAGTATPVLDYISVE
jgi:hypothetical protein